jgi:hypothetical protein
MGLCVDSCYGSVSEMYRRDMMRKQLTSALMAAL